MPNPNCPFTSLRPRFTESPTLQTTRESVVAGMPLALSVTYTLPRSGSMAMAMRTGRE